MWDNEGEEGGYYRHEGGGGGVCKLSLPTSIKDVCTPGIDFSKYFLKFETFSSCINIWVELFSCIQFGWPYYLVLFKQR